VTPAARPRRAVPRSGPGLIADRPTDLEQPGPADAELLTFLRNEEPT
jgi:hypothetical protein